MKELYEKMTPYIARQIKGKNFTDPIYKQYIIDPREYNIRKEEIYDPIGDETYRKCKGVIHRYPDRALLTPRNDCLVQCRFCFRKWKLKKEDSELTHEELKKAVDYFKNHDEIWEVILTGGEPLSTSKEKLRYILEEIRSIKHVKVVRIHTRAAIVQPNVIDEDMIALLKICKPTYVVIHCNHPDEITHEVSDVLNKLVDNGIVLLSQSALLKDINDSSIVLEKLFRKLIENRVKPYYLHHGDLVPGAHHFRTSIEEGLNALEGIRGKVSGVCWPTYVLDIPGGYGKVPLGPNYIVKKAPPYDIIRDYKGENHDYPDKDAKNENIAEHKNNLRQ